MSSAVATNVDSATGNTKYVFGQLYFSITASRMYQDFTASRMYQDYIAVATNVILIIPKKYTPSDVFLFPKLYTR